MVVLPVLCHVLLLRRARCHGRTSDVPRRRLLGVWLRWWPRRQWCQRRWRALTHFRITTTPMVVVVVIRVTVVVVVVAIAVVMAQWVTQIQLMIPRVLIQNMRPLTMLLEVAA